MDLFKLALFVLCTAVFMWVSRNSLRDPHSHGFYRFFVWEGILILFLTVVDQWFVHPLRWNQIISWIFLLISLPLISQGVYLFRKKGDIQNTREDPGLVGIEKTTELVTSGIYRYIRHPFYSSLLFLCWGLFFKEITRITFLLSAITTVLVMVMAAREESENIHYFGEKYRAYMEKTKRFIPFIF